jgi:hypothetical protein
MTHFSLARISFPKRLKNLFAQPMMRSEPSETDYDAEDEMQDEKTFVLEMLDRNAEACHSPSDLPFIARRYRGK